MDGQAERKLAGLQAALQDEVDPQEMTRLRHEIALTEALLRIYDRIKRDK